MDSDKEEYTKKCILIDNITKEESLKYLESMSQILDISVLNFSSFRLSLKFVRKLMEYDSFEKKYDAVKYTLDYILLNISLFQDQFPEDIFSSLLQLFHDMILNLRIKKSLNNLLNKERALQVLTDVLKLNIFHANHVTIYSDILIHVLSLSGIAQFSENCICKVFETFEKLQAEYKLPKICGAILNRFSIRDETCIFCSKWLMQNGPNILVKHQKNRTEILELLQMLNMLYNKCKNVMCSMPQLVKPYKEFILNLLQVSSEIVLLCCDINTKEECRVLLSIVLNEFAVTEDIFLNTTSNLEVTEFPENLKDWPSTSEIFFHISHLVYKYSSPIWKSHEILHCLSKLVYSPKRSSISISLMKSIFFIYPHIAQEIQKDRVKILGDDLLRIALKYKSSLGKIYSYEIKQFEWIMERGSEDLKRDVLKRWLLRNESVEIVANSVVMSRAGRTLLSLLKDKSICGHLLTRAIDLADAVKDPQFSRELALSLPNAYRNDIEIFKRLVLAKPKVPEDRYVAMQLLKYMSHVMIMLDDSKSLKSCCSFTRELLTSLMKFDATSFELFCRNTNAIRYLVDKSKHVDQDTTLDIVRLLKCLLVVQRRNHLTSEEQIDVDLSHILVGSPEKLEKSIQLIDLAVTFPGLINITADSVLNICIKLIDLCGESSYIATSTYVCLTRLLKKHKWLAESATIIVFIEDQCWLSVEKSESCEFLHFLMTWISVMKKNKQRTVCYFPEKDTVKSYILRSSSNLPRDKVAKCLSALEKIIGFNI